MSIKLVSTLCACSIVACCENQMLLLLATRKWLTQCKKTLPHANHTRTAVRSSWASLINNMSQWEKFIKRCYRSNSKWLPQHTEINTTDFLWCSQLPASWSWSNEHIRPSGSYSSDAYTDGRACHSNVFMSIVCDMVTFSGKSESNRLQHFWHTRSVQITPSKPSLWCSQSANPASQHPDPDPESTSSTSYDCCSRSTMLVSRRWLVNDHHDHPESPSYVPHHLI